VNIYVDIMKLGVFVNFFKEIVGGGAEGGGGRGGEKRSRFTPEAT